MILTFSDESFEEKILLGEKPHTIREDAKRRWKPGREIQFWMHNPRNVRKSPRQFATGTAKDVKAIRIFFSLNTVFIDNKLVKDIHALAKADGFESFEDMKRWFDVKFFTGVIIYFDNVKALDGLKKSIMKHETSESKI